jgi:hypothetical protein
MFGILSQSFMTATRHASASEREETTWHAPSHWTAQDSNDPLALPRLDASALQSGRG